MSYTRKRVFASCLCLIIIVCLVTEAVYAAEQGGNKSETNKESLLDRSAVGCILPLTGQYAAYGNRALEAIFLAAGFFDPRKETHLKLLIEDSQGQPEKAKEAVTRLAKDGKVIAILGPLGGAEASAAAEEAQRLAVPLITLTQKEGVTAAGSYVFRYFISGYAQISTLVRYAISERGLHSFAIFYPRDNYGQEMANLFQEEVRKSGGETRRVIAYDKAETDFTLPIRKIAGLPSLAENEETLGEEGVIEEVKPHVDFAALFIPDAAARVSMIASQLAFQGVTGVQLLGTSGWNSPELLQSGSEYLEGSVFVDGFFPYSANPQINDFVDAFFNAYDREPGTMEALMYDATAMSLRIMGEDKVDTRDRFRDAVTRLQDYTGVTGKASFSMGRDVQKDIFVLTVKNGQIVKVK